MRLHCSVFAKASALRFLILLLMCSPFASAAALEKVTIQLSWKYQFEFAAIIASKEKGYYRDAGLDLQILEGGPGINPVEKVVDGQADYGIFSSALMVEYARGLPVVALAALMQHSAVSIVADTKKGIHSVDDLVGKTIAVSKDTRDEIIAYLDAAGVGKRVKIIDKTKIRLDNLQDADAISAYIGNEGFYTLGDNGRYLLLSPRTQGIDLFGNILFTTQARLNEHRHQVEAFRAATLRGLDYALNHRKELVDIILARYNTQNKTREHLLFEAEKTLELTRPDIVEPGYMSPGRWRHVADVYASLRKIKPNLNIDNFIYDPNPKVDITWVYWVLAAILVVLAVGTVTIWQIGRFNRRLKEEIVERTRAEKANSELSERLELATTSAEIGIWDWDVVNNNLIWDDLMYKLYGTARDRFCGAYEAWDATLHPEDKGCANDAVQRAVRGEASFNTEFRVCWPDGTIRHIKAVGNVLRDEQGRALRMIGVNYDITESKRLDQLKDNFVSTISHELRTPLTSIRGSLGLINCGALGEIPDKMKQMLSITSNNTERLITLINDILDFQKLESGMMDFQFENVDVMQLFDRVIADLSSYGHQHKVHFKIKNRLRDVYIFGDFNRLMQVLANLLSNATKYSPADSIVEIAAARHVDGRLRISVSDSGPGISEDFRKRVFTPFSQSEASSTRLKGGTGLGLVISKDIVERHGGEIHFINREGGGTTFYFDLPEVLNNRDGKSAVASA